MVALTAVLLMSLLAFAVDLGYAWQTQRAMVKATDAAALAAARTARESAQSGTKLSPGTCPSNVNSTANAYLADNQSGAATTPDGFCVLAGVADATGKAGTIDTANGLVTVRGTTTADFSFARIFGLNSTKVHASSTVQWGTAPLLPIIACDVRGTNGVSGWLDDPSGPKQFSQLWSGSDSSNLCSADGAGDSGSGEYAMIDFNPRPMSETDFGPCRGGTQPADTNYQLNTVPPNLVEWIQNGYPNAIAYGQYLCGRVGQKIGRAHV